MQSLPGGMAFRIAAGRYGYDQVSAASADAVRAEVGLDRPAWQQLLAWWGDLPRLDLGASLVTGARVAHDLALHLSSTLALAAVALAVTFAAGSAVGVAAAYRPVACWTV